MEQDQIEKIIEAALLAADGPLTVAALGKLFAEDELDGENASKQIREALKSLTEQSQDRGIELKRVASGYRYQVRQELSQWVSRLWDEKPPRYTRALLETLALIAYKQPVTRGDVEQVRGVAVSQNIMRTLLERDWIKVVGQREVPGRPSEYATTKAFLDYFNLKSLDELPPLAEIKAILDPLAQQGEPETQSPGGQAANDADAANAGESDDQNAVADEAAQNETQTSTGEEQADQGDVETQAAAEDVTSDEEGIAVSATLPEADTPEPEASSSQDFSGDEVSGDEISGDEVSDDEASGVSVSGIDVSDVELPSSIDVQLNDEPPAAAQDDSVDDEVTALDSSSADASTDVTGEEAQASQSGSESSDRAGAVESNLAENDNVSDTAEETNETVATDNVVQLRGGPGS